MTQTGVLHQNGVVTTVCLAAAGRVAYENPFILSNGWSIVLVERLDLGLWCTSAGRVRRDGGSVDLDGWWSYVQVLALSSLLVAGSPTSTHWGGVISITQFSLS